MDNKLKSLFSFFKKNVILIIGDNVEYIESIEKRKKIIIVLGIILLISLIGGLIFLLTRNNNSSQTTNKNRKKVTIYEVKTTDNRGHNYNYYSENVEDDDEIVSQKTFTCRAACTLEDVTENYALVLENDGFYIYNYISDEIVYGPIDITQEKEAQYTATLMEYEGKLYGAGISYTTDLENYETVIYNASTDKLYENIKGSIYNFDSAANVTAKYDYVIMTNNNTINLFNIQTGKIDYNYPGDYVDTIDTNDNFYIINSNKIYDINNQEVFKGIQVDKADFIDNQIVISKINGNKRQIAIYDKNRNLIRQSSNYDDVLMFGKDFALVVNNKKLQLINLKFRTLASFINNYDKNKNPVRVNTSGWYTTNNKQGIYIQVEDSNAKIQDILKNNPDLTKEDVLDAKEGYGYEYYYIPSTGEIGRIATFLGGYAKPILYLYPLKKTKVTVKFEHDESLTTTYPKYENKWEVIAKPNGDLSLNGRYYYGLYWEENDNHDIDFSEGFYVESKDAIKFLEEKLAKIGFNERESNEFIMYWLPILEKNKQSLVYFELTEEREKYNKLLITPKPDSLLRVAIHVKKVNKKVDIKKQQLKTFKRVGFTAIEWGGVIHK